MELCQTAPPAPAGPAHAPQNDGIAAAPV